MTNVRNFAQAFDAVTSSAGKRQHHHENLKSQKKRELKNIYALHNILNNCEIKNVNT
jgi:hypothetical protein